jgi:hypothetical protein
MALAREWDDLVAQVRAIEGLEDFLRPQPLDTLLRAAAHGPVVVVNVSRWRCDALVVTTDGVRVVELPDLTTTEVARRTITYLQALQESGSPETGLSFIDAMRHHAAMLERRDKSLGETMTWLWDTVADPVLAALGFAAPPLAGEPWPRVWWCPTGLLTLLPLHGAGYHGAADGRAVIDRVVSSYAPTLRALTEAMKPLEPRLAGSNQLLFVGVPDVLDQLQMVDEVAREREFLRQRFPNSITVIEGSEATVAAIQDAMLHHRWAHLSCHGHQDLADPSAAGLVLSDGLLTIARISAAAYACEFAFLSACKTATGGLNLPDEAITLAAALNYAGFRHVVATLWSVDPVVAAEVAESLYTRLISSTEFDPAGAAVALHHAVRQLRGAGHSLDDWLPFIHNGP